MINNDYEKYLNAFKPSESLLARHLHDWLKSGVDEKTVREELGVRTSVAGDSWVIPIWNLEHTEILGYIARYDDAAIKENRYPSKEENITPKYRASPGLGNRFFYPHIKGIDWVAISKDPSIDIGMSEGIQKAVKLTLEGLPTIGLFGPYNWLGKIDEHDNKEDKNEQEEQQE